MADYKDDLSKIYHDYADKNRATGMWSTDNPGYRFIIEERDRFLREFLSAHDLLRGSDRVALDLGCGSSTLLPDSLEFGTRLGIDLLFELLGGARDSGTLDGVACADGAAMPFPDSSFDVVVISTVLSSVPTAEARRLIGKETTRVLKPGGSVVWYDMRVPNPSNKNITGINRKEIERIFPGLNKDLRTATLIPQVARRLGDHPRIYRFLSGLTVTRSHLIGIMTKPLGTTSTI